MEGLVDYQQARLQDPKWWQRLRLMLEGLDRRKKFLTESAELAYYAGIISNPKLTDESYQKLEVKLQDAYYATVNHLRPWVAVQSARRKGAEFSDARQKYIDAYGVDPADPKFKEWEAEAVRKLLEDTDPVPLSPAEDLQARFRRKKEKK